VVTEGRWETIQIGLRNVATQSPEQNNVGFAAALLAALPIVLLLVFLQRQLVRGLTTGAVKG
jgi:sn-glycerol 3-phosphate transport system permease protein